MAGTERIQFKNIPSVDRLLRADELAGTVAKYGREATREATRKILAQLRMEIRNGVRTIDPELPETDFLPSLYAEIVSQVAAMDQHSLIPVFNLTGTVIHTNLGRAALPEQAIRAVMRVAGEPVNLEYDLRAGKRGDRESHVEQLICELSGAEAATVVNNNAAAVVLVLTALAAGRNVIISRGELVEIGGAFRIPEVMGSAGCHLKEVGATNRTHLSDFEQAIDSTTALLLKVHTSNYEIKGFSKSVPETELATLAHRYELPFVVDLGSGTLLDLGRYGLPKEPTVTESLEQGADIVTFSGDKLLGGPQAGLVAGKRELIARLKKSPLKRALRVDKLTLAALEEVLKMYRNPATLSQSLPILRDLTRPIKEIQAVAESVLPAVSAFLGTAASVHVGSCKSQIGSGALPVDLLDSVALEITSAAGEKSDSRLRRIGEKFRSLPIPVIGRVQGGRLIFDLRCLRDPEKFCRQLLDRSLMEES